MLEHYIATSLLVSPTGQSYGCGPSSRIQPSARGPLSLPVEAGTKMAYSLPFPSAYTVRVSARVSGTGSVSGLPKLRLC